MLYEYNISNINIYTICDFRNNFFKNIEKLYAGIGFKMNEIVY